MGHFDTQSWSFRSDGPDRVRSMALKNKSRRHVSREEISAAELLLSRAYFLEHESHGLRVIG